MKSKMLFIGLGMLILNIIGIFAFTFKDNLSNISIPQLIAVGVYGTFTLFSLIFVFWGALGND